MGSQEITTVGHENRCSVMAGKAEGRGLINSRRPMANQASYLPAQTQRYH